MTMGPAPEARKNAGVVYDPVYLQHDTGEHPENRKRLEAITGRLRHSGVWGELDLITPRQASVDELYAVHSPQLIERVREMSLEGGGMMDPDTVVSPASYEVARYAAGGVIAAAEAVLSGRLKRVFALVRPPGHHATRDRSMGFCLFNNIAVASAYTLNHGVNRLLIFDWDVHHGNGTQDIFQSDPRVGYVSLHQYPHYPGSGRAEDTGAGNVMNIPLPGGCGDAEYSRVIDELVLPFVRRFGPDIIFVSAGFDGHWTDPLASMRLSITGYAGIARTIALLADELCGGRLVLALEGGYNLSALAGSVAAVFDVLRGRPEIQDALGPPPWTAGPDIDPLVSRIKKIQGL
jgi:acetoin utilization deacetylase AcuC-like enzyme